MGYHFTGVSHVKFTLHFPGSVLRQKRELIALHTALSLYSIMRLLKCMEKRLANCIVYNPKKKRCEGFGFLGCFVETLFHYENLCVLRRMNGRSVHLKGV